jgi:hypothetical protein
MHVGWYREHLRCTKASFDKIVAAIRVKWNARYPRLARNTSFKLRDRVAVCLYYLAHSANLRESAALFGMSKTSGIRYLWEIVEIIVHDLSPTTIRFPSTLAEWNAISAGFKAIAGVPYVCGAIDGTLIGVHRLADHEGWYCRKSYPAMNVQAVVDHRRRILSYSARPGAANDQSVYNRSTLGVSASTILPRGH